VRPRTDFYYGYNYFTELLVRTVHLSKAVENVQININITELCSHEIEL